MIKGNGNFEKGMRLKDYWETLSDEETILVNEAFFIFLDKMYEDNVKNKKFTNIGWANFKAAIYSEVEDKDYSYEDFLKT